MLNAAVAAFYYLRVVVYMFMRDAKGEPVPLEKSGILRVGLAGPAFLTIILGLFPGALVQVVENAARALVSVVRPRAGGPGVVEPASASSVRATATGPGAASRGVARKPSARSTTSGGVGTLRARRARGRAAASRRARASADRGEGLGVAAVVAEDGSRQRTAARQECGDGRTLAPRPDWAGAPRSSGLGTG